MNKIMGKFNGVALLAASLTFFACGSDDSSTAADTNAPEMSSAVEPASSADAPVAGESSASVPTDSMSSAIVSIESSSSVGSGDVVASSDAGVPLDSAAALAAEVAKDQAFVEASKMNDFVGVKQFLDAYVEGERRILILRHGRRDKDDSSIGAHLTELGVDEAKEVGAKIASSAPFFYGFSDYTRANETAAYIAEGRGETLSEANSVNLSALNGGWYVKNSELYSAYETEFTSTVSTSSYNFIAAWVYNGEYADAVYNLAEKSVELMVNKVIPSVPSSYNFAVFISHDQLLVPLIAYCTGMNMSFDSTLWLHYLSGIGIVIDAAGNRTYVPVEALDW